MIKIDMRSWTVGQRLALLALGLGALALLGKPTLGSTVTIDTQELANIVERKADHVTVLELADWIVSGRTDYRLIDLRDEEAYAEYYIPTAERVALSQLSDYPLYRNEKIVLYSEGGIHSAQAWFLLQARGYAGSYILFGGLDAWKDEILFPSLPAEANLEQKRAFARTREVSAFFGGSPRSGNQEASLGGEVPMPKVELPAHVVTTVKRKKRKEGC